MHPLAAALLPNLIPNSELHPSPNLCYLIRLLCIKVLPQNLRVRVQVSDQPMCLDLFDTLPKAHASCPWLTAHQGTRVLVTSALQRDLVNLSGNGWHIPSVGKVIVWLLASLRERDCALHRCVDSGDFDDDAEEEVI